MKNKSVLFVILLSCTQLFAQEFKFPKNIHSNGIGIKGTQIMVDQSEVSVGDWLSFVYNKYYNVEEGKFNEGFESIIPDTNLLPQKYNLVIEIFWRLNQFTDNSMVRFVGTNSRTIFFLPLNESEQEYGKGSGNKPFDSTSTRIKIERILSLPIVSVSYDQVQSYLAWRTELAMEGASKSKNNYSVKARLMTKEEWLKLAPDAGPHFAENKTAHIDTINKEGCYLLNVKVLSPCSSVLQGISFYNLGAVPGYSYNPDRLGLYCMFGNVWEMTQEKGIAIGGSYAEFANECDAAITKSYSGPEQNIGFRCVLEFSK